MRSGKCVKQIGKDKLRKLKEKYENIHYIIIDEKSLIGRLMFG